MSGLYGLKLESLFLVGENYIATIRIRGYLPKWAVVGRRDELFLEGGERDIDGKWTLVSLDAGNDVVEFRDGDRVMTVDRDGHKIAE